MKKSDKKKKNKVCQNCGKEFDGEYLFCPNCGAEYIEEQNENETDDDVVAGKKVVFPPYVHNSDMKALRALKAIPGFSKLVKAFLSVWDEKTYQILNLSNKIKLSETQMPKYYNMLPPICERLGIEVPELYLELDVNPNAYTFGCTKPFVVITSGLLETVPDELVETVLAHECGHIACNHVLYHTMGRLIFNGAYIMLNRNRFSSLLTIPLQSAFYYWMRCSELSADRAAMICAGTSEKMTEMCFRFAGYDKDIKVDGNKEEFVNQAKEYSELIESSKWNKTVELMVYAINNPTHPYLALRAYKAQEWFGTEEYKKAIEKMKKSNQ